MAHQRISAGQVVRWSVVLGCNASYLFRRENDVIVYHSGLLKQVAFHAFTQNHVPGSMRSRPVIEADPAAAEVGVFSSVVERHATINHFMAKRSQSFVWSARPTSL